MPLGRQLGASTAAAAAPFLSIRHRFAKTHDRSCLRVISVRSLITRASSLQGDPRFKICAGCLVTRRSMKRCAAIQVLAAKATMTIALAHCSSHSRELVTKVHQFEIFAIDAARGVTGHHDSRRRDNHQGQSGEHDADQFQGAFVCHCKTSFQGRPRKTRRTDSGLSAFSNSA
jgi:hypothetical protein